MILLVLERKFLREGPEGRWEYDDTVIWITLVLVFAWLIWFLVQRYLRARALRRPRRRTSHRLLKRTARIKRQLSSQYLRPGFSGNIHAVGIGRLRASNEYCIQVFVIDANTELWAGSGAATLPDRYRGVPVILVEMPGAGFLSTESLSINDANKYPHGIREHQKIIIGGISSANSNLTGQSGTIGYFCRRKRRFRPSNETYLLSNSHVFADLRRIKVDDTDLIMQPSPGEPGSPRPIGNLETFQKLIFDGDISRPNHVDAALARLWSSQSHNPVIPMIGTVKGFAEKNDVEIGESARKFGRTTGYTEGRVFSIYLDIWIRYDRTGQSAFFRDQYLIEPAGKDSEKFVAKGDSGSLLVDENQYATGLIFAGVPELPESAKAQMPASTHGEKPERIEGYGVANPISEVLDRLRIELII